MVEALINYQRYVANLQHYHEMASGQNEHGGEIEFTFTASHQWSVEHHKSIPQPSKKLGFVTISCFLLAA